MLHAINYSRKTQAVVCCCMLRKIDLEKKKAAFLACKKRKPSVLLTLYAKVQAI